MSNKEISHYVVTAHQPGAVHLTAKCNFLSENSLDVLVAKSRRIEVRQLKTTDKAGTTGTATTASQSPFPIVLSIPINGRLTSMYPLRTSRSKTSYIFFTTDQFRYAVISYDPTAATKRNPYPIRTHSSGSLLGGGGGADDNASAEIGGGGGGDSNPWTSHGNQMLGKPTDSGGIVAIDPYSRCIALHVYDGLITILPINSQYMPLERLKKGDGDDEDNDNYDEVIDGIGNDYDVDGMLEQQTRPRDQHLLGQMFHCRMEERTVLALTFLYTEDSSSSSSNNSNSCMPQLCILHQDSRGSQHMISHLVNLNKQQLHLFGSHSAPATTQWLKKSSVDGGSALLIPVPTRWEAPAVAAAAAAPAASAVAVAVASANNEDSQQSNKPQLGGVVILGQRQFTYCSPTVTKVLPVPQALFLAYESLPADPATGMPRYLLGDEFGNLHMLSLLKLKDVVFSVQLETLGSCALSSCLSYLGEGLVYVGSHLGDSQLVQIHDEPIAEKETDTIDDPHHDAVIDLADTTYLTVVEEYTHLGPILDFDLVPTTPGAAATSISQSQGQSQVVTASGSSKTGSLRLIRNGIGMNEYASVEIPGIQNMWSIRQNFTDHHHAYLVQSFVGETRVLGVASTSGVSHQDDDNDAAMQGTGGKDDDEEEEEEEEEEVGGTLEEVMLPGLESSASSLYVGNVLEGDRLLQITESQVRLFSLLSGTVVDTWDGSITVAAANEAGQVAVAMRGGMVVHFSIDADKIVEKASKQMDREVSCLDLHPFVSPSGEDASTTAMEIDNNVGEGRQSNASFKSNVLAVGLWDDFTVRLLSLDSTNLEEALCINLSTEEEEEDPIDAGTTGAGSQRRNRNNMMARSLCLVTLDFSSSGGGGGSGSGSSPSSPPAGVDMLFVGLGDGTLISFAVIKDDNDGNNNVSVRSKKEVCLGTQRIDLIPLTTERGGTCVLATGDRPTVIYLAGVAGNSEQKQFLNPKLCYSTVNLSASSEENEDDMDDVSRPPSQQAIAVNIASPFFSPLLFDVASMGKQHYSLCVADDANLRLGVIDDIQKLHVTTCRLGMAPRRVVYCADGRLFAVGCIESGIKFFGLSDDDNNMGNCIRFMDDTTFDDIERIDLEPYEAILSMCYATMKVTSSTESANVSDSMANDGDNATDTSNYKPFLLVGTGYALPDEDEPTRGRILVYSFQADDPTSTAATNNARVVRLVTEFSANGGVYSITQFYEGKILCSINSKTMVCQLVDDTGFRRLQFVGIGHHGHILSLCVKSRAKPVLAADSTANNTNMMDSTTSTNTAGSGQQQQQQQVDTNNNTEGELSSSSAIKKPKEMLAIVGDLMRSISLVQYYPQYETLEEVARDFNSNWTTAIEMLTQDVYLGGENWNNLYCLRRNAASQSEEVRCRLDTIGEFHLGEMCNKFMRGSLVMPVSSSASGGGGASDNKRGRGRRVASSSSPGKKTSSSSAAGGGGGGGGRVGTASSSTGSRTRRPVVVTGSQTLFGTVEGTLGSVIGLDGRTAAFFSCLERAMANVIKPVGNLSHQYYRACHTDRSIHPSYGFIDGDLVETFLDLDRATMDLIADEMNRDGGYQLDDAILRNPAGSDNNKDGGGGGSTSNATEDRGGAEGGGSGEQCASGVVDHDRSDLTVDDVLAMVEEMTMLH